MNIVHALRRRVAARWLHLLAAACFWSAVGLLFALPHLGPGGWRASLLGSLDQWWSWGLLTPLIVAVDRALPIPDRRLAPRVLLHLLILGPSATSCVVVLSAGLDAALRIGPWSRLLDGRMLADAVQGALLWGMVVYCLIVGVWRAHQGQQRVLAAELRMQRLERNFSEARLAALRMQLDPHFLFNALNAISAQVVREPRLARRMIEHLGDLLRVSLDGGNRQEIPLAEEIAFLDHYLAIQKIRFADSLRVELDVAPGVERAIVPSLLMQPLVENAIRHGISGRAGGGAVAVIARQVGDRLEIRVHDDGVGLPQGWSLATGSGLGLSVTRERIAALHPGQAGRFAVQDRRDGGTEVLLSFPFRLEAVVDGSAG